MKFTKKILTGILVFIFAAATVNAQMQDASNFYIRLYGGYGLLTPGSYRLVSTSYYTSNSNTVGTASLSSVGLGSGVRLGGGFGVVASDFLNIGVDGEYYSGAKIKGTSTYNYTSSNYTYQENNNTLYQYTCISVTPHVIFKALSKPSYLIYNRLGILLNLPFDLKKSQRDTSSVVETSYFSNYQSTTTGTYKRNLNVGLNVALGIQFRLTQKLRGFAEIFANYLVVTPKTYVENSNQKIDAQQTPNAETHDLYQYMTTVDYIKSGNIASSTVVGATSVNGDGYTVHPYTITNTSTVSNNTFNMNAVGINIGITYRF
jgi:hypothetical protein